MTEWSVASAAKILFEAEAGHTERGRITEEWPELDLATAYEVQAALIDLKRAAGEAVVGVKLGLTSRAKQERMGITSPLVAVLTDGMILSAGEPIPLDALIHPRIEPEIAFLMATDLRGPGVTAATALAAVASVHAAFEIIDSRFIDFSFALPDVIADNASSSRFLIGGLAVPPTGLDLALEAVVLAVDGAVVDTATGAAVQGHPAEALALAANELATRGEFIPAGSIVLSGGMTDAVFVESGVQIRADFTNLGSLSVIGR